MDEEMVSLSSPFIINLNKETAGASRNKMEPQGFRHPGTKASVRQKNDFKVRHTKLKSASEEKMQKLQELSEVTNTYRRYKLRERARKLNDAIVVLAIFGLILAVGVCEMIGNEVYGIVESEGEQHDVVNHPVQIAMRCVISASTVALVAVDLVYQWTAFRLQIMLFPGKPPSITLQTRSVLYALLELLICAVHPLPIDMFVQQTKISNTPPYYSKTPINLNLFLTVFMFLRVHLVLRAVLMHHNLYKSPAAHMFGPLNKVSVGYGFILRVTMNTHPGEVVAMCIAFMWPILAWIFMQCEHTRLHVYNFPNSTSTKFDNCSDIELELNNCSPGMHSEGRHRRNYLDALWFIIVTSTTV